MRAAAAAAVATGVTTVASAADAASTAGSRPAGRGHKGTRGHKHLLPRADRHLVSRFSYGVTPKLAKQVRKAGGAQQWFENQVRTAGRKDRKAEKLKAWWPSLYRGPADLWDRQIAGIESSGDVMNDYDRWVLLRRIHSRNQLLEVMTEFWENHFNVPTVGAQQFTHRVDYGQKIRKHALTSFDKLLRTTATHPAMLIYLSADESTKSHPNENLGRELLELHTVGVGNYDEHDVVGSSRILTGWTVERFKTWTPSYDKSIHYRGKVHVKGFKAKNRKANGQKLTKSYLRYLARHPQTAERIAEKLVLKFVGDAKSKSLVAHLKQVYLDNDTEIVPVLMALIDSKQFKRAVGQKLRDPGEDVVATYRALNIKILPPTGPTGDDGSAVSTILQQAGTIGLIPFHWGSPDGQPIDNDSWATAGRLLGSMRVHFGVANQFWPSTGVTYRDFASWLPAPQVSFADLVDHLSQEILHRPASGRLLGACCTVVAVSPDEVVSATWPKTAYVFPRVLATILDTPEFLSR